MSIINELLTGGILIGRICQALGGGVNANLRRHVDEEFGITVEGDVTAGGVVFFRSTATTGKSDIHIFNPSTKSTAVVTVPNESDAVGTIYLIPPTQKILFDDAEKPETSPLTNVLCGLTGGELHHN